MSSLFACSSSESTKNANAENIEPSENLGDFENVESKTEIPTQTVSNTNILEKDYYRFKGTINENLPIVLDLNQENGNYVGSYYYTKHKMILRFDGKKNANGEIVLQVYDKLGNIVEYITGRINQNTFIGKWQNADRTKTFPIYLTETMDRSILFYTHAAKKAKYEIITINQVPEDGDLTSSQKKILELQNVKVSNSKEAKELIKKLEKKSNNNSSDEESYIRKNLNVLFNDFSIATIQSNHSEHTAGSPTFYNFTSYFTIDAQKGEEITMEGIFGKANLRAVEEKLRKHAEYVEADDLTSYSINRFVIGKKGITFIFDENPSGSAAGYGAYDDRVMPEDYVMSWSEIEDLIQEDSPVRRIFEN